MAKKKKKGKQLKQEHPDIVKKRMIKGAMRRVYRQSYTFRSVLQKARVELPPKILKDGSIGKKNQVRYECAHCHGLFSQKNVQVDHIDPVVRLHESEEETDYNTLADRIWCEESNLQVLCSTKLKDLPKGQRSCHGKKTQLENFLREKWEGYKKINNIQFGRDIHTSVIEIFNQEYEEQYLTNLLIKKKQEEEKEEKKQNKKRKGG